jgi:hypothetical protein
MRPKHATNSRPWVEGIAGSIGDPVTRLRFLRAVAPLETAERERWRRRWSQAARVLVCVVAIAAILLSISLVRATAPAPPASAARLVTAPLPPNPRPAATDVWRVDETGNSEVYSNGLRIDNGFAVSHRPRSYLAFPASGGGEPARRHTPAGIVFHSTESPQVPFEAGHNGALIRLGESLLDYLQRRRSYHFLIDRFGRVYRVVAETDAANHAGHSVWADGNWLYIDLNDSFLGVAFEARTGAAGGEPEVTAAQVHSGAMLTEMLRVRYRIPARNCVTHAQVSVNPSNMRVGYHVDWASGFPFEALGLPDNYAAALSSVWAFGFEWDEAFRNAAGMRLRVGMDSAAQIRNDRAIAAGGGPFAYRKQLEREYRRKLGLARGSGSTDVH